VTLTGVTRGGGLHQPISPRLLLKPTLGSQGHGMRPQKSRHCDGNNVGIAPGFWSFVSCVFPFSKMHKRFGGAGITLHANLSTLLRYRFRDENIMHFNATRAE
jgi:hypothetical protein